MVGNGWRNVDKNYRAKAEYHFNLLYPWPINDSEFDVVTAIHVLEHFSGEELFHILWEAGRVLKPGGTLAVIVPYGMSAYHFANPFHKQAWTEDTPFQFDRRIYEQENSQSYEANQGQKLHAWTASNFTFVPLPDWAKVQDDMLKFAMKHNLNVISEMSFTMTLEEK